MCHLVFLDGHRQGRAVRRRDGAALGRDGNDLQPVARGCLAEAGPLQALQLDERSQKDTRLQLKALGAHWHEAHRGVELIDCPLCDKPLEDGDIRFVDSAGVSGPAGGRIKNGALRIMRSDTR